MLRNHFFPRPLLRVVFLCLLLCLSAALLFSAGAQEEAEPEIRDPVWTLAITSFDTTSLSASRAALAETVMRELVNNIDKVSYRVRVAEEYAYYEALARSKDLSSAAQALANKRNERDQLIFKGSAAWRYRRDLKTLDKDIEKLEEAYREAVAAQTLIAQEPTFTLAQENLNGQFPLPPKDGGEYRFCKNQQADAFVTGNMSEYHGRLYVTQKLYVRYTNSYVFQDSIIFSPEDSNEAMDDLAARVTAVIAGIPPAELRISAQPDDALVLLNHGYAGRGVVDRQQPPGKVTLEVYADGRESVFTELELKPGELTEVTVDLLPTDLAPVNITVPGKEGSSVYYGSLYMGEAPLTLSLPLNHFEFVFSETIDGEESKAVFLTPAPNVLPPPVWSLRLPSFLTTLFPPKSDLRGNELSLRTRAPYDPAEERVDKARRAYYWAWGGTWVSAIAAWMINGYANSVIDSYNNSSVPTMPMYEKANQAMIYNYVGIGVVGAVILVEIFQTGRYIHTAGLDAPPYVD